MIVKPRDVVENLLMNRAFLVDGATHSQNFSRSRVCFAAETIVRGPFAAGFACMATRGRYNSPFTSTMQPVVIPVHTDVHRFEELIAGRPYLIEVSPVDAGRWRAYIVRLPGVPTALMPFYGATPDDAASQLRQWLTRAHQRANGGSRRV